jgi:hypothetical protein
LGDLNQHVQPVHGFCDAAPIPAPPTQRGSWAKCDFLVVPARRTLVVETVSYAIQVPQPGLPDNLVFGRASVGSNHLFFGDANGADHNTLVYAPTLTGVVDNTSVYRGAYATRLYLEENQVLSAGVSFNVLVNSNQSFAFSGYLLNR